MGFSTIDCQYSTLNSDHNWEDVCLQLRNVSFVVAHCHNHEVVGKVIVGYVNQEAFCLMQKWDITYIYMLGCPALNYQHFYNILNIYYHDNKTQQLFINVGYVQI